MYKSARGKENFWACSWWNGSFWSKFVAVFLVASPYLVTRNKRKHHVVPWDTGNLKKNVSIGDYKKKKKERKKKWNPTGIMTRSPQAYRVITSSFRWELELSNISISYFYRVKMRLVPLRKQVKSNWLPTELIDITQSLSSPISLLW